MTKTKVTEQTAFALFDRIYIQTREPPRYSDVAPELKCSNCTFKAFLASWLTNTRCQRDGENDNGITG